MLNHIKTILITALLTILVVDGAQATMPYVFNNFSHTRTPLVLEPLPNSGIKVAGVYWLPDYLEKNLDFNDRSQSVNCTNPGASDYNPNHPACKKVDERECKTLGYEIPSFVSDWSKYNYTEFLAANKVRCYKNFKCKKSYQYSDENCTGDYVLAGESCSDERGTLYERCDELKCPSGFTAGLTTCSPEAGFTYTTNGTAGSKVCGKCTAKSCPSGTSLSPGCDGINYKEVNSTSYSGSSLCKKCEAISCPTPKTCSYGCKTLDTSRKEMCGSICTECAQCASGGSSSCAGQKEKCGADEVQTTCKDCSGTTLYSCRKKACADEGLLDTIPTAECGKQSCAVKTVNGKTCYSCRNVQTGDTLFADFTLGYSEITNGLQMPDKKIIGMAIRKLVSKGEPIQRAWGTALKPSGVTPFATEYEEFEQPAATENINKWGDYDAMQTTLGLFEKREAYPAAKYVYDYKTDGTNRGEWSVPTNSMNREIDFFLSNSCQYVSITDAEITFNQQKDFRNAYQYLGETCKAEGYVSRDDHQQYWSCEQGSALGGGSVSKKKYVQTDHNNTFGSSSDKISGKHKVWPVIDFCRIKTCSDAGMTFSIPETTCGTQSCAKKVIDGVTCYACREPIDGDALYDDFTIGYQYASKGLQLPYENKTIIGYIVKGEGWIMAAALQPSSEPLQFSTSTDLIDFVETTEEKYGYCSKKTVNSDGSKTCIPGGGEPYLTAIRLMQSPEKYPAVAYAYNYTTSGTKKGDWTIMYIMGLHVIQDSYKCDWLDSTTEFAVHMRTDYPYLPLDCDKREYWRLQKYRYPYYVNDAFYEYIEAGKAGTVRTTNKPTEAYYVLPMIEFCRIQEERGEKCTATQAAGEYAALPEKYKQYPAVAECPERGDCKVLCNGEIYVGGCLNDDGSSSAGTNNGDYAYCSSSNLCNQINLREDAESTVIDACNLCSLAGYASTQKSGYVCTPESVNGSVCYKQCCKSGETYDAGGVNGAKCYKCGSNQTYSLSEHKCICNSGYTDIDGQCYQCNSGYTACKNPYNNGVYCLPNDINNAPCSICTFNQACDHQPGKWKCTEKVINGETCYANCDTWEESTVIVKPDGSTSVDHNIDMTDDACRHIGSFE